MDAKTGQIFKNNRVFDFKAHQAGHFFLWKVGSAAYGGSCTGFFSSASLLEQLSPQLQTGRSFWGRPGMAMPPKKSPHCHLL